MAEIGPRANPVLHGIKNQGKLFHIGQMWHCFSSTLPGRGKVQVGLSGHSCPGILRFTIFNKKCFAGNPEVCLAVLMRELDENAESEPVQTVTDTPKLG
jgi:hypothetical protein